MVLIKLQKGGLAGWGVFSQKEDRPARGLGCCTIELMKEQGKIHARPPGCFRDANHDGWCDQIDCPLRSRCLWASSENKAPLLADTARGHENARRPAEFRE